MKLINISSPFLFSPEKKEAVMTGRLGRETKTSSSLPKVNKHKEEKKIQ